MSSPSYTRQHARTSPAAGYALAAVRPTVLLLAKALCIPLASAAPLSFFSRSNVHTTAEEEPPKSAADPDLYLYLGVAIALVLLGGIFAGLTIAFMGQDETYLQVIATSGEGSERRHANRVLNLLNKGKHWVLVTLLLGNVITNETLPIVLDRSLGGGWPAVLSSTVLIVIFGEIAPQSICVRYGLSIGAFCSPFVLLLMWILAPVAWPTAKLLDWLLGEDHGTMYKKAGLKTLVQLHKTLGQSETERLMDDEVTIINSVLDLKEKPVGDIMTPMQDVFIMSADTVLDERMMDTILSQGYSRIPIYAPDNRRNFIGMLLVKILITYDPEDAKRVRDFALATLPETGPHTSCLDIINFFQEGKSHMVLVSDYPGEDRGSLGVVTLEDVIEELIGEEIIDESDVFVDVHKAIRRMTPAPRQHYLRQASQTRGRHHSSEDVKETEPLLGKEVQTEDANGGPPSTFLVRRKSSTASETAKDANKSAGLIRTNTTEMREHLRHLGPSNVASRPRATKYTSVKIKPGVGTIPENQATSTGVEESDATRTQRSKSVDETPLPRPFTSDGYESSVLRSAGRDASDGAAALRAGYGTMSSSGELPRARGESADREKNPASPQMMSAGEASMVAEQKALEPKVPLSASPGQTDNSKNFLRVPGKVVVGEAGEETDQVGDMSGPPSRNRSKSGRGVRSGSITETEVDVGGGMKKVVLETTSSSSSADEEGESTETEDEKSGVNGEKTGEGGSGSLNRLGLFGRRDSTKDAKKKKRGKRKKDENGDKNN